MRRNRENRRLQELQENNSVSAMSPAHEVPGMGSLFDEALIAQEHRSRQTQIRAAQKLRERQREEERTEWTKRSFASLKELKKRIEASQGQDTIASTLYLEEARTMWEEFTSVKALYPADKVRHMPLLLAMQYRLLVTPLANACTQPSSRAKNSLDSGSKRQVLANTKPK
jgi:hypothetical protein